MKLLSRADDFGSARAANKAILEALEVGYAVRNVSCMAVAPYVEEGAEYLKKYHHVDIGIHVTLNAEWDEIKWGPLTNVDRTFGLTDSRGYFFASQQMLAARKPDVAELIKEYDAQLDKLTALGLQVSYADSHMFPELFVEGLEEEFDMWIRRKGLLNSTEYYSSCSAGRPDFTENESDFIKSMDIWLGEVQKEAQVFYLTHPAVANEETFLFANKHFTKGVVQKERQEEYLAVTSPHWEKWCEQYEITPVRYSQADKQNDSKQALRKMLGIE